MSIATGSFEGEKPLIAHGSTGKSAEKQVDGCRARSNPKRSMPMSAQSGANLRFGAQPIGPEAHEHAARMTVWFDQKKRLIHLGISLSASPFSPLRRCSSPDTCGPIPAGVRLGSRERRQ